MRYNLGDYRYDNFKIYKRCLWFFYVCIDEGPYPYIEGVTEVNRLCGIVEEPMDISHLDPVQSDENTKGSFLVNFKNGNPGFANDPLPACVEPLPYPNGRLSVTWENGWNCIIKPKYLNIYEVP
jgi:hypothetical protein